MKSQTIDDLNYQKLLDLIHEINPKYKKVLALNQKQTAEVIGVSDSTLENWRREKIGIPYKKIDSGKRGRVFYLKTDIVKWLTQTIQTA